MIQRIKTHNILNGILFSMIEFVVAALIVAPFAIYYVLHGRTLYAAIAIGIILNFLVVVAFGLQQYKNKEKDIGIRQLFNKNTRETVGREHPHLGGDTTILVITLLLPFVMVICVLYELLFERRR